MPHICSKPPRFWRTWLSSRTVPLLFVSRQFVSWLLVFNNSFPLLFVSTTFRLQTIRLLTIRLQQFVSTIIRLHYFSSPLFFVSTTIRLHTIRLLTIRVQQFVSTTIRLHYFSSPDNSSPYDSSPTIRLHYYSSPLLFIAITICLHYYSSPLLFVSTTIRLHYYSDQLQFYHMGNSTLDVQSSKFFLKKWNFLGIQTYRA